MDFVADGIVEPAPHMAPNEFDWRHAADLLFVRLPQCAVKSTATLVAARLNCFRKLDLLEIRRGEALLSDDYRRSRFRVDKASCVRARTRKDIGVPPEVAELRLLATDSKQSWPLTQRQPA